MASRSIKNRQNIKKKRPFVIVLVILAVFVALIGSTFMGLYALGSSWVSDLEDYDVTSVAEINTSLPSEMYDSAGTTMLAKFQLENREPVELSAISPYVLEGTVATEDERFYDHGGFDLLGIARAAVVTLTGSGREGASTITQQFVRNTILSEEMDDISFKRKVREMYLSVKLEEVYTKDEILRMYLNTINYGNATYGIQAASQRYFSKNAADLTLAEAATLIGIPQSPTNNEPLNNAENCVARRNVVLDRMLSNGYITQAEHDAAQAEPLVVNPTVPSNDGYLQYPYFASYVKDVLTDPDGFYKLSQAEISKGGLKIITTLDIGMQQEAEQAIADKKDEMGDEALEGSLVAIEPSTGYVKALVGGDDWESTEVNLATGKGTLEDDPGRPCGSSFKTFTLLAALEAGISPQTIIDCTSPARIPEYNNNEPFENIDNINYGWRSIERAFTVSSNTGFVRLQLSLGVQKVADMARRLGVVHSPLSDTNASLTLGTSNVTMLDMASAYAVIANGGVKCETSPVLQVFNSDGTVMFDNTNPQGEQVISPEVAHAATEVMKTVVTSYEGTGTAAALDSGQPVAAKTGTSSDYYDITFCGITPQLSVSIWFGDPNHVEQLSVHANAANVFSQFVGAALADREVEDFPYAANPTYTPYTNPQYNVGTAGSSSGYSDSYSYSYSGSTDTGTSTSTGTTNTGTTTGNTGTNTGTGTSTGTDTGGGTVTPGTGTGGTDTGGTDGTGGTGGTDTGGTGGTGDTGGTGAGTGGTGTTPTP